MASDVDDFFSLFRLPVLGLVSEETDCGGDFKCLSRWLSDPGDRGPELGPDLGEGDWESFADMRETGKGAISGRASCSTYK